MSTNKQHTLSHTSYYQYIPFFQLKPWRPRSFEAARHQPRPSTHACASGSRVRQPRVCHFNWNEPTVLALTRNFSAYPARALQARNPQCPCPSWTGPWTQTARTETTIFGPDGRAAPASAHGPRNPQCPCPSWTGPWSVCSQQFPPTRSYHGSPTSCVCLCDIGPATPEPTGSVPSLLSAT